MWLKQAWVTIINWFQHLSHNDETWNSYTLPSKHKKNHVTHPLNSTSISIFSPECSNFCYIWKCRQKLHFDTFFSNCFDLYQGGFISESQVKHPCFYWIFIGCFNQHDCNFGDGSKTGNFKPPWNKGIFRLTLWRHDFCPWSHL